MTPNSANNSDDQHLFKMLGKVLLTLYLAYAAFHIFSGVVQGCDLRFTFLVMSPIRELHTIPMVNKIVDEVDFTNLNANDDLALKLNALVGRGIVQFFKSFLTLDNCLLIAEVFEIVDTVESLTSAAPAPTATPQYIKSSPPTATAFPTPWFKHIIYPPNHGKLTTNSVPLWTAASGNAARQKGRCVS